MIIAAITYALGVVLLTASINVPMNRELEQLIGVIPDPASVWTQFSSRWTGWNTVRTTLCLIATICAVLAVQSFQVASKK